jgi:acetyl-CoA acetyltransferase
MQRGTAAIVGVATDGVGEAPGFTAIEIAARASLKAISDAGLRLADIDGLFGVLPQDPFGTLTMAEYLGIRPRVTDNNRTGGSSFELQAMHAAMCLEAGLCSAALIYYGSVQRSLSRKLAAASPQPFPYEDPYRPFNPPSSYALAAARHMHDYGTTREQLAQVAVSARAWANLNPDAFARGELSVDECLASRMVSDPLTVRDCCLVTDGAAAVVMVRRDRARLGPQPPVYLLGGASATWHRHISQAQDLCVTAAAESGPLALAMAGCDLSDIDVVMLYDAFTINVLLFLEDLGFCRKGEGGAFVAGGAVSPGGSLPVNTNGGGLSCVHPGMYGLFMMTEAVTQIRGTAGARQVRDADIALVHANGGVLSSQSTLVLGSASAL